MAVFNEWVRHNSRVYLGNAFTVREYRCQLRTYKAMVLWVAYLLMLAIIAATVFSNISYSQSIILAQAQTELRSFYYVLMAVIATMVALVAPAMTATAINREYTRRTLDLVFSAPIHLKYLLVGNLFSSFRYVWLLLVLSLPISASCVVFGGATWSDVLITYLLLSLHGLLFAAFGLLVTSVITSPVSAVVLVYLVIGAFVWFSAIPSMIIAFSGAMASSGAPDAPFVLGLNIYMSSMIAPTYTELWGHHIPNWVIIGLILLMVTRFFVLAAASALSRYGSKETISFRIHGIVLLALFCFLCAYGLAGFPLGAGAQPLPGLFVGYVFIALCLVLPLMTCYADGVGRKQAWDGVFTVRRMLSGSTGGALPYLAALWLTAVVSAYAGAVASPAVSFDTMLHARFLGLGFWAFGLIFMMWAIGRVVSALTARLTSARSVHYAVIGALLLGPPMFIEIVAYAMLSLRLPTDALWFYHLLAPLGPSRSAVVSWGYGVGMALVGVILALGAEAIRNRRMATRGVVGWTN